jgi:hypothetical protein
MGLFSTTLSIYKRNQSDLVDALKSEMKDNWKLSKFDRIEVNNDNFHNILDSKVYSNSGIFYLITDILSDWTSIIELNVNLEVPFYLYEIGNKISFRLNTYTLSFHLHDDDVLYYNLDYKGDSVDGYNSDVQYFENEPLKRNEILNQRHNPSKFSDLLPPDKTVNGLIEILNRGYWNAFDNNELDKDGIPNDEKYYVDEEQRLKEIGRYLEIYSADDFPYANWYEDIIKLDISKCFLLRGYK